LKVLISIYQIRKSDTLYAFSFDGSILRSTNDAEDWIKLGTGNSDLARLNYYLVNNEVIGTYFSQLFHFKIDGNIYLLMQTLFTPIPTLSP
jgi:hypothetical protein